MYDIWRKPTKKERKRRQLEENIRKGRAGEEEYRWQATLQGKEVERTGRGHDYIERRRDLLTGRVTSTRRVEVKTGGARLSRLQKRIKKKKKTKVYRTDPFYV